jgi:DNA-binding NarL/FixJ family response regulator
VLLASSDRLVLDILRAALTGQGIKVVGEVETVEALRATASSLRPTVVVAADCLGAEPVDAALPAVLAAGAKVVVVSSDPSSERLSALLSEGVTGYLLHDADPDEVVAGVLAVARGAAVLNPTAAAMVLSQWRRLQADPGSARRLPTLTPRERDVLAALVEGLPTKGIAQRLSMATKTVENHKIRIFDKLGVRTQAHAVSVAISSGLIRPATAVSN